MLINWCIDYVSFQLQEMIVLDSFKANSAAIVLDFLIRHNIINPDNGGSFYSFLPHANECNYIKF